MVAAAKMHAAAAGGGDAAAAAGAACGAVTASSQALLRPSRGWTAIADSDLDLDCQPKALWTTRVPPQS
jgi:hypothetical protein